MRLWPSLSECTLNRVVGLVDAVDLAWVAEEKLDSDEEEARSASTVDAL